LNEAEKINKKKKKRNLTWVCSFLYPKDSLCFLRAHTIERWVPAVLFCKIWVATIPAPITFWCSTSFFLVTISLYWFLLLFIRSEINISTVSF
jgi:hypothetical protein